MLGWILRKASWFVGVEKRSVITEVMTFGDPHMDKRRCLQVMRKLLYLLNQGQTFTETEAADVLVSATKLFRFNDIHLRRLFYLIAKELCPIVEEVGILENSLHEDLCSRNITVRATAIRLLSRITNGYTSTQTEEYLKEAIMDENQVVFSAGLVCALHLLKSDPRIGINLCEQVGKAARSFGRKRFHALCLLFRMQQIETFGVRELVRPHIEEILSYEMKDRRAMFHPLSVCLVIRFITLTFRASGVGGEPYPDYLKYLRSYMLEGGVMVSIEGLRSVQNLRNISRSLVDFTLTLASSRLLTSDNDDVVRFGRFRAMHELGMANGVTEWEHEYHRLLNSAQINYLAEDLKRRERERQQIQEVTQIIKSKPEAPAANNLRRRSHY